MRPSLTVLAAIVVLAGATALAVPATSHAATHCGGDKVCQARLEKARHLRTRDAAAEGRAAAAQGDFRLGRIVGYGQPGLPGVVSDLPGVGCIIWSNRLIGKQYASDDYIEPGEEDQEQAASAFLERYNRAVVTAPNFPYPDLCAPAGKDPAPRYTGEVKTFAQAVRSGNPDNLKGLTATPEAVNAVDEFHMTPLGWATMRGDLDMAMALIAIGADPNNTNGAQTPLGLALLQEKYDLARRLRAKGAKVYGDTGLCGRDDPDAGFEDSGVMEAAESDPTDPKVMPPEPVDPPVPPVGNCGWAGLLLQKGQIDLLEYLLQTNDTPAVVTTDNARRFEYLDTKGDLDNAFKAAVLSGDMVLAKRLLPNLGDDPDYPGDWLGWLYRHKAYAFLADRVVAKHLNAAHSPTEAHLWQVALEAGQYQTFAMLWDYGHALNLLAKAQLPACEAAVRAGDQPAVLSACIKPSFERTDQMVAVMRSGDNARFKTMLDDSASWREDYKIGLRELIVVNGTPEMLDMLMAAGETTAYKHLATYGVAEDQYNLMTRRMYDGPLKAEADDYVRPHVTYRLVPRWSSSVAAQVVARGNPAMIRAVARYKFPDLVEAFDRELNFGQGLDANIPGITTVFNEQEDTEKYPTAPTDPAMQAKVKLLIPLLAETQGPQALLSSFYGAARMGWTDTAQLILDQGLDLRKVQAPWDLWSYTLSYDSLCRPSMARLMIRNGLETHFYDPAKPNKTSHILWMAAAACRDGETMRVIVKDGGFDVNEMIDGVGHTALDEATRRGHKETMRVLIELGGKPGKTLYPEVRRKRTQDAVKAGGDPDFWPADTD